MTTQPLLATDRPVSRREMFTTLENTKVTFEEVSSFSPVYGTWTSPSGERIVSSIHTGGGGAREYRGVKMLYGVAEEPVWASHHNTDVLVAKAGEEFAVSWNGGQFGQIVSKSMSMGYYTIARGAEGTPLVGLMNALACHARKKSLYTLYTIPSTREYYSDDLWKALHGDSYKWEELTRVTTSPNVLHISDGKDTVVFYYVPGTVERYVLSSRSRILPEYSAWRKLQQVQKLSWEQGTRISRQTIAAWGRSAIYKLPNLCYPPIKAEECEILDNLLLDVSNFS